MLTKVYIKDLYSDDLEGSIDSIIERFNNLKLECEQKGFSDLSITTNFYYEQYEIQVHGKREEFPWETENRLKVEALDKQKRLADKERREKAKAKKEQNEKELFEKLKLKYEKENLS